MPSFSKMYGHVTGNEVQARLLKRVICESKDGQVISRFGFVNIDQTSSDVTHWGDIRLIKFVDIPDRVKILWRNINTLGALKLFWILIMGKEIYYNVKFHDNPIAWTYKIMEDLPKPEQLELYGNKDPKMTQSTVSFLSEHWKLKGLLKSNSLFVKEKTYWFAKFTQHFVDTMVDKFRNGSGRRVVYSYLLELISCIANLERSQ